MLLLLLLRRRRLMLVPPRLSIIWLLPPQPRSPAQPALWHYAALREQVPGAEVRTGAFESTLLDGVAQVVISPGLSLREPVATEALVLAAEQAARQLDLADPCLR